MRALVVANDHVGSKMAGPGIRSLHFATELARDHDITLVVPFETDISPAGISVVREDPWDARLMSKRVRAYDVVVAQKLPVPTMQALARSSITAIYDLYAPVTLEALAQASGNPGARLPVTHRLNALTQEFVLACGDAFVCASEKQRDLWLGALLALGRVDDALYESDPTGRTLIDVVPFGIDVDPPVRVRPVLRGVLPGIGDDDCVLLWGGGIWNWLDPLTVIEGVSQLAAERDDVKLVFMGLRHPNPAVPRMEMERRAVELAERLNLRDRVVFFNENWVAYEERGAYYLEADLGVSAHFDDLEARFAYRTRLLDCFWSGLPVVATAGDTLSDLVRARQLGEVVAVRDSRGWAEALDRLLGDADGREAIRGRLGAIREELAWPTVVAPLRRLVDARPVRTSRVQTGSLARYVHARAENALLSRGAKGAAGAALRRISGRSVPLESRIQPPLR